MAAAATDKFSKAYQRLSTTLSADKAQSASAMTLSSAANFPTDTGVIATVYEVDSDGLPVTSSIVSYVGTVSGSQITNLSVVEGTDQAHVAGDVVTLYFTAEHWNRAMDGILVEHAQDGTHKAITTTSITNAGDISQTDGSAIDDDSGNELVKFAKTASAVNEVTVTNAATGNAPSISATGSDTNISMRLKAKGTGTVQLGTPVAFSAYGSSATTINNTTYTTITYDTEDYDFGGNFASNVFTAPYNGVYSFTASNGIDSISDGKIVVVAFLVNSTLYRSAWVVSSTPSADRNNLTISRSFSLTAGDTVAVQVYHNYGSSRSSVSGATYSSFTGYLVGRTD